MQLGTYRETCLLLQESSFEKLESDLSWITLHYQRIHSEYGEKC